MAATPLPAIAAAPAPAAGDRLAELRGPVPARHHDARTIAALTSNPGCSRRAVLDAAGVDKRALAERIGYGPRFGQSPFAIARGNAFEKLVKAEQGAALLTLLREQLRLDVAPADQDADVPGCGGWIDLGSGEREERYRRTRELVAAAARDPRSQPVVADHPLLRLDVGGRAAYVEPDLLAFRARARDGRTADDSDGGAPSSAAWPAQWRWYLAEIKSFAMIDGRADPMKVAEAATQAAVYVLAFQALLGDLGLPAELAATEVVLICPKDFGNTPAAALVDVRRQLAAVRRQLDRLPGAGALLDGLDPDLSFDLSADEDGEPARDPAELGKSVAAIEARYAPECISRCDMAFFCRDEARAAGSTGLLGRSVRDALGGVETTRDALELGSGSRGTPHDHSALAGDEYGDADLAEAARLLSVARRARREALREAATRTREAAA